MKGKAGCSGARILFPFLESPELALNSKGSLLCFRRRQINVNLLLFLSLLGTAGFPCGQLRDSLTSPLALPLPLSPGPKYRGQGPLPAGLREVLQSLLGPGTPDHSPGSSRQGTEAENYSSHLGALPLRPRQQMTTYSSVDRVPEHPDLPQLSLSF